MPPLTTIGIYQTPEQKKLGRATLRIYTLGVISLSVEGNIIEGVPVHVPKQSSSNTKEQEQLDPEILFYLLPDVHLTLPSFIKGFGAMALGSLMPVYRHSIFLLIMQQKGKMFIQEDVDEVVSLFPELADVTTFPDSTVVNLATLVK